MDELLEQFLIEAPELVEQAAADLLTLERNPAETAAIDSAFRAVHTLKGSVALFDFAPMGAMLHAAEGLLEDVRKQGLVANKQIISTLLACLSASEVWLKAIGRTERLPPGVEHEAARLTQAIEDVRRARKQAPIPTEGAWMRELLMREADKVQALQAEVLTAVRYVPARDCFYQGEDPLARLRAVPELVALDIEHPPALPGDDFDPYACTMIFQFLSTASADAVRRAFAPGLDVEIVEARVPRASTAPQTVESLDSPMSRTTRVDTSRIELLADMVGELIVAKNEFAHLILRAAEHDVQLARALSVNQAGISRLAGDMHRAVMSLRMVPLSRTLRRFARVVRDLGDKLGKGVQLSVAGDDIEADKVVVDGLYEPMLHVLRNAVDHGIEDRLQREIAGKPTDGRIDIVASRVDEEILISVTDDGAGIDATNIRRRAQKMGLGGATELESMSDAAVLDLIFAPGFTTSSRVSEVSGRGVGMDAVRAALDGLGGRIAIESAIGQGTTLRLIIPQAVVITTILVVVISGERFGIPIDAIVETTRVGIERVSKIRSGLAFVLRDRTIPLMHLSALLGLPAKGTPAHHHNVVVARLGTELVGLEIDDTDERIDVLVRPMAGLLSSVPGFLGTALLGDGRVLMVLNIQELADANSR
jgi:two-component system, chemotaxis family, sensor kinase CheA